MDELWHHSLHQSPSKASQTELQDLVLMRHRHEAQLKFEFHFESKNICIAAGLCQGSGYVVTRIWHAGDGRVPTAAAEMKSLDEMLGYSLSTCTGDD